MSMNETEIQQMVDPVPVWHDRIELSPGIFTPTIQQTQDLLAARDLPEYLSGLQVLDLGARDGFSVLCVKRAEQLK